MRKTNSNRDEKRDMKISEQQTKFNANTRSNWESFESHRHFTTATIGEAKKYLPINCKAPTLAVLGAGNGNDLELQKVAESFSKIHLFDFDPAALEHLKTQQLNQPSVSEKTVIEPPVDLSGISKELENLPAELTEPEVLQLANRAREPNDVLPGRQFDVVVSTCLTTQLLDSVVNSIGDDSPFKHLMMIAIRDGHLKLMDNLIRPGGAGVLITYFVSSDTLPELQNVETSQSVLDLARKAIDQRNFFTGANPWAIKDAIGQLIVEDPFEPWSIAPPWRWEIGKARSYLVTAISFSKPLAR